MPALAQTVDRPAGPVYKQGAAQQPGKANRSTFSVSQRDAIERAGALRGQRGRALASERERASGARLAELSLAAGRLEPALGVQVLHLFMHVYAHRALRSRSV